MLKRTRLEINKKFFDIVYKRENILEGRLFHGKILLGKNVVQFSLLKRKDGAVLFEPKINALHEKLIIEAIDHHETSVA
jgi:hypothetical protein